MPKEGETSGKEGGGGGRTRVRIGVRLSMRAED